MIIVTTGTGKGKTTAAIGQIIRVLGHGGRVCLVQLFKGREFYGEQKILKKLPGLTFVSFAPKHPLCFTDISRTAVCEQCARASAYVAGLAARKKKYDLIVLEEFNIAFRDGFMPLQELLAPIQSLGSHTTIMITGRGAPKKLIACADLVTEMKEIKHPYKKGIPAQKGIEY